MGNRLHKPCRPKGIYCSIAIVASLVLTELNCGQAATINAASAAFADVSTAVALSKDGDTVLVPAGTAAWATPLTITKGITIQGATTTDTSTPSGTATDQTIIQDAVNPSLHPATQLVAITLTQNQVFRLTGITFRQGPSGTGNGNQPAVILSGTCPGASGTGSARIDHCHFYKLVRNMDIKTAGWVYGVLDHNIHDDAGIESLYIQHDGYGGQVDGHGSWNDGPNFGSNKFMFVETNCFNNLTGGSGSWGSIDGHVGTRVVIRYNYFNGVMFGYHGTEESSTGVAHRGGRVMEAYNNILTFPFNWPSGQLRSGTGVFYNNKGYGNLNGIMLLENYRYSSNYAGYWKAATGQNPWELNDSHGAYYSGTVGIQTASTTSIVDARSPGWTTNQWSPTTSGLYTVVKTTLGKPDTGFSSSIFANTSNSLVFPAGDLPQRSVTFSTGDTYAIYRFVTAMDQPGRGKGDLISGYPPVNTNQGNVAAYPRNALEPVFAWNNTVHNDTTPVKSTVGGVGLYEGRDVYNRQPQSGDYLYPYTPYPYPHPLVSGPSATPSAPQNLHVTGP
jgi:hypothetical protein